jgi:hypothetical protein
MKLSGFLLLIGVFKFFIVAVVGSHNKSLIETSNYLCGNHDFLPKFNPTLYNNDDYEPYNNCYAFATMDREPKTIRGHKLQPGEESNLPHIPTYKYRCSLFQKYVLTDHPTYFFRDGRDKDSCPCGFYKAALYITPTWEDKIDYHWYRQSDDGTWCHKPGSSPVLVKDASGDFITDPETADRDYTNDSGNGYNYSISCGYLCVEANPIEMKINNSGENISELLYKVPLKIPVKGKNITSKKII